MTILTLSCEENVTELGFPTTSGQVREAVSRLSEGAPPNAPVRIIGVRGAASEITCYVREADLRNETDALKVNTLTARFDAMTVEQLRLSIAALRLDYPGGLNDALYIAGSLDQYEIFPELPNEEELDRFLAGTAPATEKYCPPGAVRPDPDYFKISAHVGMYTEYGFIRRRDGAPKQMKNLVSMLLMLTSKEHSDALFLPASADQLEQAKRTLEIEDLSQAVIACAEYTAHELEHLIPQNGITVEYANELSLSLQQLKTNTEKMTICAALEVEEPSTFSEALGIAMEFDDYERITYGEGEYARRALRGLRTTEELLEAIDGYTDFDQLGRDKMDEDGVRQTGYGLVRRLSKPFPAEKQEPQMGGPV